MSIIEQKIYRVMHLWKNRRNIIFKLLTTDQALLPKGITPDFQLPANYQLIELIKPKSCL